MDRDKYLTYDEMRRLRLDAKSHASESIADRLTWLCVDMALQTGLRVNELADLTRHDIDFDRQFIRVPRSKRKNEVWETIGMSESLREHLREHVAWLDEVKRPWKDTLWPGKRGPWTTRGLQQAWQKACRRIGIICGIHTARHTCAMVMLRQNGNIKMVQKHLGHTDINTTSRFYAGVPIEDMIRTLDEIFER